MPSATSLGSHAHQFRRGPSQHVVSLSWRCRRLGFRSRQNELGAQTGRLRLLSLALELGHCCPRSHLRSPLQRQRPGDPSWPSSCLSAGFLASFDNRSPFGIRHSPPVLVNVTFGVCLPLPALAFGSLAFKRRRACASRRRAVLLAALPASLLAIVVVAKVKRYCWQLSNHLSFSGSPKQCVTPKCKVGSLMFAKKSCTIVVSGTASPTNSNSALASW